jgi:hypothetical protein
VLGEIDVPNEARLKAGPLDFKIIIEASKPMPAAPPAGKPKAAASADDELAAFLLEGDDSPVGTSATIPDGSTVMEIAAPAGEAKPEEKPAAKKPDSEGDTRSAAADILRKYQRRPRT